MLYLQQKIKKTQTNNYAGEEQTRVTGNYIYGTIYSDGSGSVGIRRTGYYIDYGNHDNRVKELKELAELYMNAYKELKSLKVKESKKRTK